MAIPSKNTLFDPELVKDLVSKVKGHSSLAKLCGATPVSFNGNKEFVFSMDSDVDIVAEGGAKSHGGLTIEPKTIIPIKFEYGARVSDEFMYASEEEQIDILKNFNEGFAKKLARGMDMASVNGINPRTQTPSAVVGDNCIFKQAVNRSIYSSTDPSAVVSMAVDMLFDEDVTGLAGSNIMKSDLAKQTKSNGDLMFPELAWGGKPDTINGLPVDFSTNITHTHQTTEGNYTVYGVVGDFASGYKWGIAKDISLEVIPYGDPDNTGSDLKGHNQIYLRAEAYLGWAVLNPDAFVVIAAEE